MFKISLSFLRTREGDEYELEHKKKVKSKILI